MKKRSGTLSWTRVCYGVDLAAVPPRIVRGERAGRDVRFTRVDAGDARLTADIRKGVPCVGCVPARETFFRWQEAPFRNPAKARKVLPTLLDLELPFPIESCVYAVLDEQATPSGRTRALAVGARATDAARRIAAGAAAGFDPVALDVEGLALWFQSLVDVPRTTAVADEARAVVHVTAAGSTLVVGRGDEPTGVYGLPAGDASAHVDRLLRAQFEPGVAVQWVWCGEGAAAACDAAREAVAAWPGPSSVVREPAFFLARGLARRALLAGPATCNLRIGALAHPAEVRRERSALFRAAWAALAAGLLLVGVNVAWRTQASRLEREAAAQVQAAASRLAGYALTTRGEDAVREAENAVAERIAPLQPFADQFSPTPVAAIPKILACAARDKLRISQISVAAAQVGVRGDAPDWKSPEALKDLLQSLGVPGRLEREDARGDGRIPFVIEPVKKHD